MADDVEQLDLVLIGSGPAGEKGAVQAAYYDGLGQLARRTDGASRAAITKPS